MKQKINSWASRMLFAANVSLRGDLYINYSTRRVEEILGAARFAEKLISLQCHSACGQHLKI
ncbi:MAG: hypothetical protein MSJ26_06595 [Oscillospiraceae bacterium]|nr:hypothetical protein [Oscillospiraceae bacterium]